MAKLTKAAVRVRLSSEGYSYGSILLDGSKIGSFVSYGKGGRQRGNVCSKTAYGSRISRHGLSIEEEAGSVRVLLDKVAGALAKAVNSGDWPVPQVEQTDVSA